MILVSEGEILPHIELPPGISGVNVTVSVAPEDSEQIIVNDNGSRSFSIGYRIDQHNQQTENPCLTAPPTCCNASAALRECGWGNEKYSASGYLAPGIPGVLRTTECQGRSVAESRRRRD